MILRSELTTSLIEATIFGRLNRIAVTLTRPDLYRHAQLPTLVTGGSAGYSGKRNLRVRAVPLPRILYTHLHLTHSGFITKFEKDKAQLSPEWEREKSVSATFCDSEECRDLITPGAHIETTTKLYGMSYRTSHSITIYDQQFGRRRGGKSPGGLSCG